jgi:hypothetical protein
MMGFFVTTTESCSGARHRCARKTPYPRFSDARVGQRFYDNRVGRWTTQDPLGVDAGLNQYVFCGDNPVNFVDPLGLEDVVNYASGIRGFPITWHHAPYDQLLDPGRYVIDDHERWHNAQPFFMWPGTSEVDANHRTYDLVTVMLRHRLWSYYDERCKKWRTRRLTRVEIKELKKLQGDAGYNTWYYEMWLLQRIWFHLSGNYPNH